MLVYSAGSVDVPRMERMANESGQNNLLFTFAHKDARDCARHLCKQRHRRVIIDSGAFSTWNKGIQISLKEYIAFCLEILDTANCSVMIMSLDTIAGSRSDDRLPTPDRFQEACEASWKYFEEMRAAGIPAIPTFHQFDDTDWLFRMLDEGTECIALSPRKRVVSPALKIEWLGDRFRDIGLETRVHGLGIASPEMMEIFPFYSVDSSSWLQGKNGNFRYFDGRRVQSLSPDEWAKDSAEAKWDDGTDAIAEAHREYRQPGQGGNYHFMMRALEADARLQGFLSRLWKQRGVYSGSVSTMTTGTDHLEQSNILYKEFCVAGGVTKVSRARGMDPEYVDWAIRLGRETASWQAYQKGEIPFESLADQLAWGEPWDEQLSLREIFGPRATWMETKS